VDRHLLGYVSFPSHHPPVDAIIYDSNHMGTREAYTIMSVEALWPSDHTTQHLRDLTLPEVMDLKHSLLEYLTTLSDSTILPLPIQDSTTPPLLDVTSQSSSSRLRSKSQYLLRSPSNRAPIEPPMKSDSIGPSRPTHSSRKRRRAAIVHSPARSGASLAPTSSTIMSHTRHNKVVKKALDTGQSDLVCPPRSASHQNQTPTVYVMNTGQVTIYCNSASKE
jgi:hypothetical protein